MIEYPQQTKIPEYYAKYRIAEYLLEDIPEGDITSAGILDGSAASTALIQSEEDIIFAGEMLFYYFFDDTFKCGLYFKDGEIAKSGDIIALISGPAVLILSRERVLLNLLQRLCGIATLTRKYVDIAKPFDVKILDTRKTTPGLRLFEKYAVTVGGGYNHRMDLSSGILIKDNHIKAAGSISKAIEKIRKMNYKFPIELEVENLEQIKEGLLVKVDGFLLDNMPPENIIKAVNLIRSQENGNDIFIEASGGINLDNINGYAQTGVNAISVGALTHSVKASNIHMEFI